MHAAYCGHPVAGDDKYGQKEFNTSMRELGLTRMFLHAHHCGFTWPGGAEVDISVPLPEALKQVLDQLSLKSKAKRTGRVPDRRRSR